MKTWQLVSGALVMAAASRAFVKSLLDRPAMNLHGCVALITGGSRGLGLLLARELGQEGCRVALCARDAEDLAKAGAMLEQWGVAEVLTFPCDVANAEQVEAVIAEVENQWGAIDLLVNNAGVIQAGPIQSQTVEDFRQAMDIMFWGVLHPSLTVLPRMLQRKSGHIVNITSVGGKLSAPHLLPYNAAKFAAVGFSEGLTAETWGTGVQVTTVVPGLMRTGSYLNAFFKGNHAPEFRWFALGDNLPWLSMDAEKAAARIVEAIQNREAEVILTVPARLGVWMHGLFPALTMQLLGLANRLMLPSGSDPTRERGLDIQQDLGDPFFNRLTAWGRAAARRFNQVDGGQPITPSEAD
ncbi:MAG: SDR family NAD(P)-dependent oxidoreductase [Anaerolineae bacterium]|nr:SDR family NAD(P)-dependent oxidoreductase [Anaerolineae bacterium]